MSKIENLVSNVSVYGLAESIYRSGYPMMTIPPNEPTFRDSVLKIQTAIDNKNYEQSDIKRAITLANAKGGGHNQFLSGIIVQFDVAFPNKVWVEAERYKFLTFISSFSSMHRITSFNIDSQCNQYVDQSIIDYLCKVQNQYMSTTDENKKKELYYKLLYNTPSGFVLTAGMTTNYRCLQNIYEQRHNHRLKEWQDFCKWIESLPLSDVLITRKAVQKK